MLRSKISSAFDKAMKNGDILYIYDTDALSDLIVMIVKAVLRVSKKREIDTRKLPPIRIENKDITLENVFQHSGFMANDFMLAVLRNI